MPEILCPYCCSRFMANKVHFRLTSALEAVEEVVAEEDDDDDDFGGAIGRSRKSKKTNNTKSDGKILDERLYAFYRESGLDETAARADAMQYGYVEFNPMNPDILYNRDEEARYGYVNEISYRGQRLTQRICPNCHKNLVADAGKYPMYMFSVIGDTNVGKTVFLTVLEAVMEEHDKFNISLSFVGTPEEREYYKANNRTLLRDRELLEATIGRKPPLTFKMVYHNAATGEPTSVFLTFCDIPGEMCREKEHLQIFGKHLKASSGLLFLVDPTRFQSVRLSLGGNIDKDDNRGNSEQLEVIEAIGRFLTEETHDERSDIPTAILITKSDLLKNQPYFSAGRGSDIINAPDWRACHNGFVNDDEIKRINERVIGFLEDIGENRYITKLGYVFSDYSFFINSALGHKMEIETDDMGEELRKGSIEPYRITEPFYWALAENFVFPRRIKRVYQHKTTHEEKVLVYYYTRNNFNTEKEFMALGRKHGMIKEGGWFSKSPEKQWSEWRVKEESHS